MKLILGSDKSFLMKYGYELTGISKDRLRIGYVVTASKGEKDTQYLEIIKQELKNRGYYFEELDIEGKTKEEIEEFFKDKNVLHVEGGNTLYLLRAIRKTKFDEIIEKLLKSGVVYIGTSAGASIMGPTIEFSSRIPAETQAEELIALNYVPFIVKAHYKDENEKEYKEKAESLNYPVRFLRDGQGILVEDGKYAFYGEGKEVKIGRDVV